MLKLQLSGKFDSQYSLLVKKSPAMKKEVEKRVIWFRKNPNDARLDNHVLKRRMKGKFAFSITDDIRIVYEWLGKNSVRFLVIGGHNKVYGRINK